MRDEVTESGLRDGLRVRAALRLRHRGLFSTEHAVRGLSQQSETSFSRRYQYSRHHIRLTQSLVQPFISNDLAGTRDSVNGVVTR